MCTRKHPISNHECMNVRILSYLNLITAAKRIARFMLQTKGQKIIYTPCREQRFRDAYGKILESAQAGRELPNLVGFSDSDYAGCSVTLKSTSGSVMFYRGVPILWASRRQAVLATSTCEAEYVALFDTVKVMQAVGFAEFFDEKERRPVLFGDNQSSIVLAKTTLPTKRSKHMDIRYHYVKEYAKDIAYCPTGVNMADPLTKPVPDPLMFFQTPTPGSTELNEKVEGEQCLFATYCRM